MKLHQAHMPQRCLIATYQWLIVVPASASCVELPPTQTEWGCPSARQAWQRWLMRMWLSSEATGPFTGGWVVLNLHWPACLSQILRGVCGCHILADVIELLCHGYSLCSLCMQCAGGQQWAGSCEVHAQHPLLGCPGIWRPQGCGYGSYGNPRGHPRQC